MCLYLKMGYKEPIMTLEVDKMKRIAIPIDGSPYSDKAMEEAKNFVELYNSEIVLIHVKDLRYPYYQHEPGYIMEFGIPLEEIKEAADIYTNNVFEHGKEFFADYNNVLTVLLEGDPASAITDYVNKNKFDLIIMGSQGLNSALQSILLGSVTNKVIHHSEVPVLVVK
ncbi:MAG TPA: hypothetical protein DHN33_05995 [Eubacteriaceae bacterium]|nr:hypothetical protein [Eubacteriaceae bacterium]